MNDSISKLLLTSRTKALYKDGNVVKQMDKARKRLLTALTARILRLLGRIAR